MNVTQKEVVVLACHEMCAARGEPPCGAVEPTWTPCRTCGRIAAIVTQPWMDLKHRVQHAVEELHSQIDGGEEMRGRDSWISEVIRILQGESHV
jgi:hypothetical protein